MKTMKIRGTACVARPADLVQIELTVKRVKEDCGAAAAETDGRVAALRASLAAVGFDAKDLKTTAFDVSAEYESVRTEGGYSQKFVGYACREGLKLSFPYTPERLSAAVSAVTDEGAEENFCVGFTVSDPAQARKDALASAYRDALGKALTLARASGQKLGEIAEINCDAQEESFRSPSRFAEAAAMSLKSARAELNPEDVSVTASVTVVWELV